MLEASESINIVLVKLTFPLKVISPASSVSVFLSDRILPFKFIAVSAVMLIAASEFTAFRFAFVALVIVKEGGNYLKNQP